MSARPSTFIGAFCSTGVATFYSTAKRALGFFGGERPLPQALAAELNVLGQWVQYLGDQNLTGGMSVAGGATIDTLTVTGNEILYGSLALGPGQIIQLEGTGYVQHGNSSRTAPITQAVTSTGTAPVQQPNLPGYYIPPSSSMYCCFHSQEVRERLQSVTLFYLGYTGGTATIGTFSTGAPTFTPVSAVGVSMTGTSVTIPITSPTTVAAGITYWALITSSGSSDAMLTSVCITTDLP